MPGTIYYNAQATPGELNVSPSIQYVTNTGGVKAASEGVVLGVWR